MHRSRLAGFIIDCAHADLPAAATFWSAALGMATKSPEGDVYVPLDAAARDVVIEVQRVDHASRLHLDIESDDIDAEAARLEKLGAKRVAQVQNWWVMEAPSGHRFCVVRGKNLESATGSNVWP